MKRSAPWEEAHAISSDSDSEEDVLKLKKLSEGELINKKAETYQVYMKLIKIPANRGSQIPFTSWQGLGQSVKQLYGQPLHYLTNILLKQWDLSRVGSPDEHRPLDSLVHPLKAEALIWVTEEAHRRTASHHYIAKLWASDPLYHANIDAAELRRKRQGGMSYEALSRHGYGGGPSVLKVPPPRAVEKEQDWSWSVGKRSGADDDGNGESYEEREKTRAAVMQGEKLLDVQMKSHVSKKEKGVSFSQKEKRKRDLGQASRAKNYVEEEKRLLRDNGVYSGFDS